MEDCTVYDVYNKETPARGMQEVPGLMREML